MKKRVFSLLLSLAMCLSLLPTALAAETHTCADTDGDHVCDTCWEHMSDLCADMDGEHSCDTCGNYIRALCADENGDHVCDTCESYLADLCVDEDKDHACEVCGNPVTFCEDCDWDDDNICDLCGEGIYPSAGELNVEAEAGDGRIDLSWIGLEDVGEDTVARYTVYCYAEGDSYENAVTEVYEPGSEEYSHTFLGLENGVTYEVGVAADYTVIKEGYADPYGADASTLATPVSPYASLLTVGETVVVSEGEVLVERGEGWAYDAESGTLTLRDANITTGYAYEEAEIASIYADGDLNILLEGTSYIASPSGEDATCGIWAAGNLAIYGSGSLHVAGGNVDSSAEKEYAESIGIGADGTLTVAYDAQVTAVGGTVTAPACAEAYSDGVLALGDVLVEEGGTLEAIGGTVTAMGAYSGGIEILGSEENYRNVAVYNGTLKLVGGEAIGIIEADSTGLYGSFAGLYVWDDNARVTASAANACVTSEEGETSAHSNGVYLVGGDVGIDAGTVTVSGGSRSGQYGNSAGMYTQAYEETDENGDVFVWHGGCIDIDISDGSRSAGPSVTVTTVDGEPAMAADMDLTLNEDLQLSSPKGGKVMFGQIEPEREKDVYFIADENDRAASRVVIEPQTQKTESSSSAAATYKPVVKETEHGEIAVSPKRPEKGDTVTVTLTPEEGYMAAALTVTDKKGNTVEVTEIDNGTYRFTQPSGKVTIEAAFEIAETVVVSFTDVEEDAWYQEAVDYVVSEGLMNGINRNRFDPYGAASRAMIVTILWRMEDSPVVNYAMAFDDVAGDSWYAEAVRWAAAEGIVTSYSDTVFDPTDSVRREQLAAILWRYAKYKGMDVSVGEDTNILSYDDAFDISEYAIPAMQWACGAGIINGKGEGILAPADAVTRAETAQMLMRFLAD